MEYECDDVNELEMCDTLSRHREAFCGIKM